jgi:alpha-mannosidase
MEEVIIAASTHWDREWYRSFTEFRIRLCELFNRLLPLLEQGKLDCYTFDGQCVVLEDYLEVCPENEGRIRSLVKQGRLSFGPLYNLPDEFLSGGEALILRPLRPPGAASRKSTSAVTGN